VEQSTTQFTAHNAEAETNQPELGKTVENRKTEIALATVTTQLTADKTEAESNPPELGQTIEKLKTEIALATTKIAELEKATATAEAARIKAAKASVVAETAKREIEQTSTTVKSELEATMAQLNVDRAAVADARTNRWENTLPGAIGGLFVVLTASIVGFFVERRKMVASRLETEAIDFSAQHQNSELETVPYAGAIVAFERELEQQVAAINATH
jgi:chromosome segregation ATPase